jgi:hypothetical protein
MKKEVTNTATSLCGPYTVYSSIFISGEYSGGFTLNLSDVLTVDSARISYFLDEIVVFSNNLSKKNTTNWCFNKKLVQGR